MKKIKVIDLLNMISKGEEVPKEIRYKNFVYGWVRKYKTYTRYDITGKDLYITTNNLNDEVEIIEEEKEIEKFHYNNAIWGKQARDLDYMFKDKINELIDAVNGLKKEGKR